MVLNLSKDLFIVFVRKYII